MNFSSVRNDQRSCDEFFAFESPSADGDDSKVLSFNVVGRNQVIAVRAGKNVSKGCEGISAGDVLSRRRTLQ